MTDGEMMLDQVTPEMRVLRARIYKKIKHEDIAMVLDVMHWMYVDLVLNNIEGFDDTMKLFNNGHEIAERCARRYYGREQ